MAAKDGEEKIVLPCKWITRMEAVALASRDGPLEQSCKKSSTWPWRAWIAGGLDSVAEARQE